MRFFQVDGPAINTFNLLQPLFPTQSTLDAES